MSYGNMGVQPSNNLWVGNNYSSGYPRMNYLNMNNQMNQPMNQMPSQPQTINNILQVMGPESAQSYQVGPNSHVILMDSNRPVFYRKQSDDSGYSETEAFQFFKIPLFPEPNQETPENEYVTKNEFEEFKKMIEDLVMKNE